MWQEFRKFGLLHHDFPTMLWNVNLTLRSMALTIDPRNKKLHNEEDLGDSHTAPHDAASRVDACSSVASCNILSKLWLLIITGSYYYVYVVSMVWFVFWRCRRTGEVLHGIIAFSLGNTSQIGVSKLLWMFAKRKDIRVMVSSYLSCDALILPNTRFSYNLHTCLRDLKKRAIIIWIVLVMNGVIYIVTPIFRHGRRLMEDNFVFFGLEPMLETPNYEIAYTLNAVAIYAACVPAASVTAFFMMIAGYSEAQMLSLSYELTNLWEDTLKYFNQTDFKEENMSHHQSGVSIEIVDRNAISKHEKQTIDNRKVIESSGIETNEGIEPSRTIETIETSDSLEISRIAGTSDEHKINRVKKTNDARETSRSKGTDEDRDSLPLNESREKEKEMNAFIKKRLEAIVIVHTMNKNLMGQMENIFQGAIALEFLFLIIGIIASLLGGLENTYIELPFATVLVANDCVTGQRMKDACLTFERAVYNSKWENFDVVNQKIVLLLLLNAQKEMLLSAGGIATLTFECLMSVFRMTYSAYTTLRSTI